MIYLDHNATSPLRTEAKRAMTAAFEVGANPSSVHAQGRAARMAVEAARHAVAAMAGATPGDVIFTASGTEADATALWGVALSGCGIERLIVSAVEHDAVLANARLVAETLNLSHEILPVDGNGIADVEALRKRLATGGKTLVALMAANNETGALQPCAMAAEITHAAGGLFFCDAVAAAGKTGLPRADYLTLAGHKIGGPMGTGALILAPQAPFAPVLRGGGQERKRRAGSENVVALAGFGAAARVAASDVAKATERVRFEQGLRTLCPEAVIFAEAVPRLWNTTAFALPGLDGATALMALDLEGICVSRGAACASGTVGPSHVLTAMGVDGALARSVLRVSFGWNTQDGDADAALEVLTRFWQRTRKAQAAA